ncbi:MAG: hypothetical protein AMS18_08095 [Gemmatimonas sp. SG8_17]|nr:MAG: hypothetical protein AMS18_08095 [Gemmatimonas sp. SG8_17]
MDESLNHALEARVRKLEKSNRRLVIACFGLAALTLVGLMRWGTPVAEVVRARLFQVVDDSGLVRIELRHDSTETGLFIRDVAGDTRLGAAQFAHGGGGFALHGPEAKGAAVLYLKGAGSLTFFDSSGTVTTRVPTAVGQD